MLSSDTGSTRNDSHIAMPPPSHIGCALAANRTLETWKPDDETYTVQPAASLSLACGASSLS